MAANSKGDRGETLTLQWLLNAGGVNPTRPTARKLALYTTLPGEDGSGAVEVSTGVWSNYAQQNISFGAVTGTSPAQAANDGVVDLGTAVTSANVTVLGYAILDQTGGILYGPYTFPTPIIVQNGNPIQFPIGALIAQED